MTNLKPIENSSNIKGYEYEPLTECLFIGFKNGTLYSYDKVPQEVLTAFLESPSKGLFLAQHIKPHYKCTKFTAQEPVNPETVN